MAWWGHLENPASCCWYSWAFCCQSGSLICENVPLLLKWKADSIVSQLLSWPQLWSAVHAQQGVAQPFPRATALQGTTLFVIGCSISRSVQGMFLLTMTVNDRVTFTTATQQVMGVFCFHRNHPNSSKRYSQEHRTITQESLEKHNRNGPHIRQQALSNWVFPRYWKEQVTCAPSSCLNLLNFFFYHRSIVIVLLFLSENECCLYLTASNIHHVFEAILQYRRALNYVQCSQSVYFVSYKVSKTL